MDCYHRDQEASSFKEATGDSEASLDVEEATGDSEGCMHDAYYDSGDDDDGAESCNGCERDGGGGGEDIEEEEEDDDDEEKLITWSAWTAMEWARWGKGLKEENSRSVVVDEEENRQFWETCLASGYP